MQPSSTIILKTTGHLRQSKFETLYLGGCHDELPSIDEHLQDLSVVWDLLLTHRVEGSPADVMSEIGVQGS